MARSKGKFVEIDDMPKMGDKRQNTRKGNI
jgi:hypothetical protein